MMKFFSIKEEIEAGQAVFIAFGENPQSINFKDCLKLEFDGNCKIWGAKIQNDKISSFFQVFIAKDGFNNDSCSEEILKKEKNPRKFDEKNCEYECFFEKKSKFYYYF